MRSVMYFFFAGQMINGLNQLGIDFPLVLQIFSMTVINVMLFGNLVQSTDARISIQVF